MEYVSNSKDEINSKKKNEQNRNIYFLSVVDRTRSSNFFSLLITAQLLTCSHCINVLFREIRLHVYN